MNELKPLLDLLGGKAGWLTTLLVWIGALSTAGAFTGGLFKRWVSDQLNRVAASSDLDDDEFLTKLFSRSWYRLVAFLSHFTPFHLPTLAELQRAIRLQQEAAIESGGNLRAPVVERGFGSGAAVLLLAASLLAGSLFTFSGCTGLVQVAPGADPIAVVAEWTAENAANTIDQFLAWERNNEAALLEQSPALHAAADNLRDNAEGQIKDLRTITKQYKRDRTAANGERTQAATNALLAVANSVRAHMGLPPLTPPKISPTATDLMKSAPTNRPPATP